MNRLRELRTRLMSGQGIRDQLARGALGNMAVTILGMGIGFLVQIAIARILGVSEFGIYTWSLACINVVIMIACCGLEGSAVREVPSCLMDGRWARARGFLLFSVLWVGGSALVLALILFGAAWLARDHVLPGSTSTLAVGILVAPLFAVGSLRQAALRALKHVVQAQVIEAILRPVLLLVLLVVMVMVLDFSASATAAMSAQLAASAAVFVIGGWWVVKSLPLEARRARPEWDGSTWLRDAFPFLAISGASAFSSQAGMLALGAFGTAADTGIYAAVTRIADFAMMGLHSLAYIASPLMVEVLKQSDRTGLNQVLRLGAWGSFAFALLAALGVVVAGDWVLAAFGKAFLGGHDAMYWVLAGVLIYAFGGVSGFLLPMSGHAGMRAAIGWISAVGNLATCMYTVPLYGVNGAAMGYVVAALINTLLCLYVCWRYHRVWAGLH